MSCGLGLPVLGSSSTSTVIQGGVYRSPWKLTVRLPPRPLLPRQRNPGRGRPVRHPCPRLRAAEASLCSQGSQTASADEPKPTRSLRGRARARIRGG